MLKKLMLTTAVGAMMVTGALAQSTTPPASESTTPPASQSTPANPPAATQARPTDSSNLNSTSTTGGSTAANVITRQSSDQLLASKFKGTDVLGSDNQKIGDVSDILFDKSGKVDAYVISVGGFLGVGAKEVALAPSSFQVVNDNNTVKLKTSMTKDELKQAANFEAASTRTTTGSGASSTMTNTSTSPRPATSPSSPKE
jgi:sporulation protein YlmC with PRC-barrel domain